MLKLDSLRRENRILITGGTGFLGTALIERLRQIGFKDLVVLARSGSELSNLKARGISIVCGSVEDSYTVERAMIGACGVFHLAAFKNLALAQQEPRECVKTNVEGTQTVLDASFRMKPRFVVFASSSAAADVKGVYGATKYLGEQMFAQLAEFNPSTLYRICRLPSLWGAAGGLLDRWTQDVREARPIKITDRRATRFFMTREEAAERIIESISRPQFLQTPCRKAVSLQVLLDAYVKHHRLAYSMQEIGLRPGEVLHQTVDGIHFSDAAEQHTVESFTEEFLCPTK